MSGHAAGRREVGTPLALQRMFHNPEPKALQMKTGTDIKPRVLSAESLQGDKVKNTEGEDLGEIKSIMLDLGHGRIAYAVLSFGGIMGLGDKLFALPWSALELDTEDHAFILDVPKERLEAAKGFDKDHWPDFADTSFRETTYRHYGQKPYWA